MNQRGLVTGVTAALLWSFVFLPSSAHAWSEEKCRRVVFSGNEYKFGAKTIEEMIFNIESTDIDARKGELRSPWEMGMIPNLTARKLGYQYQLKMISSWVVNRNVERLDLHPKALWIVRDILKGNPSFLSRLPAENHRLKQLLSAKFSDRSEYEDVNPLSLWAVCAYYQPANAMSCYEDLTHIVNVMAPIDGITARDRIYQVLKNPKYSEPLSKLALEYINIIEKGLPLRNRKLDEDLLRVLGSENMKWNTLAVLSARGANFFMLFNYASQKDFRTLTALAVISSAALYFDSLNKEMFSFPRGVKVQCDNGKSYHFWMSAYLARRFGSKWAAYLSEVGYQMKSKTEFRNPSRAFTDPWNSIANQKIRLDLAYSSAGAEYGEYERKQYLGKGTSAIFHYDIDEKLEILEDGSDMLPPLSQTKSDELWDHYGVPAFMRWNQVFRPEKVWE